MLQNRFSENYIEVGCDEAGRGCLAGPVFVGAVILPDDFYHPLLNDSKQLTEKQRELLRPIIEKEAIEWAVVAVSAQEIDQINILNASIIGMHLRSVGICIVDEHLQSRDQRLDYRYALLRNRERLVYRCPKS